MSSTEMLAQFKITTHLLEKKHEQSGSSVVFKAVKDQLKTFSNMRITKLKTTCSRLTFESHNEIMARKGNNLRVRSKATRCISHTL